MLHRLWREKTQKPNLIATPVWTLARNDMFLKTLKKRTPREGSSFFEKRNYFRAASCFLVAFWNRKKNAAAKTTPATRAMG